MNGFQDALFVGKLEETFCHYQLVSDPDRQFTDFSFWIERDIDPGMFPDIISRTGCIDPVMESYPAKTDYYFFHGVTFISFSV